MKCENSKTCNGCGKEYSRPKNISEAQWDKRLFCSRLCSDKNRPRKPDAELSNKTIYRSVADEIGNRKMEHRSIMEQALGRELGRFELVHHINGNKRDNRLGNLQVMTPLDHSSHHNTKHEKMQSCAICGLIFEPKPTKRGRSKTCGIKCGRILQSLKLRNPSGHRSKYRDNACPSEVAARSSI